MDARELIRKMESQLLLEKLIEDSEIEVKIIGNSKEARAKVFREVEGKIQEFEVTSKFVGVIG